jgi:hypothetical protein
MHPIQEHLLRTYAAVPDDEVAAIVAHLYRLSGELRVIVSTMQLQAPSDPGAALLGAAAEYLQTIAAVTTPSVIREEAAAQLRGLMCAAAPDGPPPGEAPATHAVWGLLGMLAQEAATGKLHRRDRQVLRRVCAIAARQLDQHTPRSLPVATGRLTLVRSDESGGAP